MVFLFLDTYANRYILSPYKHIIESEVVMSSTKIADYRDIRAELARHGITRREVAEYLGLSYSYVKKILTGIRSAESRREEILKFIDSKRGTR